MREIETVVLAEKIGTTLLILTFGTLILWSGYKIFSTLPVGESIGLTVTLWMIVGICWLAILSCFVSVFGKAIALVAIPISYCLAWSIKSLYRLK